MKKIWILCGMTLLLTSARGQQHPDFAPIGAYFKYRWTAHTGWGPAQLKVVGDTLMNQELFKKIVYTRWDEAPRFPSPIPPSFTAYRYLRLSNNTVYESILNTQTGLRTVQPLYNFQAQVGDSIVQYETFPAAKHVWKVDSIGSRNIGGIPRRTVIYKRYCQANQRRYDSWRIAEVVEGIGILNEGWFWMFSYNCGLSDVAIYNLECYSAGDFTYPANRNCTEFRVDTENLTDSEAIIYPNPVENELNVRLSTSQTLQRIEIRNLLGQKQVWDTHFPVSVAHLPNGTYFVTLLFDRNRITQKIRIQH